MTEEGKSQARIGMVSVRLSDAEAEMLRNEANRTGQSVSTLLRQAAIREYGPRQVSPSSVAGPQSRSVGAAVIVAYGGSQGQEQLSVGSGVTSVGSTDGPTSVTS